MIHFCLYIKYHLFLKCSTLKIWRVLEICADLCTALVLAHFLQIKLLKIDYIGNGTYPSVTFSVAYLSVFLYFECAHYFSVKYGSND